LVELKENRMLMDAGKANTSQLREIIGQKKGERGERGNVIK
jgi:hypothetical protein